MKKSIAIISFIIYSVSANAQSEIFYKVFKAAVKKLNENTEQQIVVLNKINRKLKINNDKLDDIINLLEKNNHYSESSKNILKEELDAKKIVPDYVLESEEVSIAMDYKKSITEAYKTAKGIVPELNGVDKKEKEKFLLFLTNQVMKANSLLSDSKKVLNTNSIISPEERMNKISNINLMLEKIEFEIIKETKAIRSKALFSNSYESLRQITK